MALDKTNTLHPDRAVVVRVDIMADDEISPTPDVGDTIMAQLWAPGQNEAAVYVSAGTILVVMRHCSKHVRWFPEFLATSNPNEEEAKVASWRAGLLTKTLFALDAYF